MSDADDSDRHGADAAEPGAGSAVDAGQVAATAPASRRLLVLALLVGVLLVYVPLGLLTTVAVAFEGVWWPLVVSFIGLIVVIVAALWTWLGEPRMVSAQAAAIALLLALSATFFVMRFGAARPDDPLSLTALIIGAAAAALFLATGRATGTTTRRTRSGLGVACLLLALHLAVLHPLDWFLPVGTWALAAAVFVARAILTHPGDPTMPPPTAQAEP